MALKMKVSAGECIGNVCKKACEVANEKKLEVHFTFNDVDVFVPPNSDPAVIEKNWSDYTEAKRKAYFESPEYKERQKREAAELKQKMEAHMVETASTEAEMREAKVPCPYTKEQLVEYIESLVDRNHDYGSCCYALSMAAAAFNYVSHRLGVTGFQASCADLDFLRRTRSIKGPFIILKAEDALYPQYNLREKLEEALKSWEPFLKEQAQTNLNEKSAHVHPDVHKHWEILAK